MNKLDGMGKKGMVFTIMALFLLVPMFVISNLHLESNKKMITHANMFTYAERLNYIENDIVTDIMDLLGYGLNITQGNSTEVRFEGIIIRDSNGTLDSYESYVESKYNELINAEIDLDPDTGFRLNDMDVNISEGEFVMDNLAGIDRIRVRVKASETVMINQSSAPADQGTGTDVEVVIENYYDQTVLDEDIYLDISLANAKFSAFTGNESIDVWLADDMVKVENDMNATMMELELVFNDSREVEIVAGSIEFPEYLGISKSSELMFGKG